MAMNSMYELRGYDGFKKLQHPSNNVLSEDTARILKHGYYASVSYVDELVGQVIQHLKELNLYDNTIIVIWGDHGWKLGEHNSWCKQSNYNIDIHVPLLVYSPYQNNRGKQSFEMTELVDLFPSLCDLAGIDSPEYLQGSSFVPLMEKPNRPWKPAAFSQFHRRPKVTPDEKRYMGYSLKTKKHHLVEWYYWNEKTKKKEAYVTSELYDNQLDPDENKNIAHLPENSALLNQLSQQLKAGWRAAKNETSR